MKFTSKAHKMFDPEDFSEHQVEFYDFGEFRVRGIRGIPYEILVWKKPGTTAHYLRFFRLGHQLFVSGDWYDGVYSWSEFQTLSWIANTDFGYFHGKCVASKVGVPALQWRSGLLKERIISTLEDIDRGALIPHLRTVLPGGFPGTQLEWVVLLDEQADVFALGELPDEVQKLWEEGSYPTHGQVLFGEDWREYASDGFEPLIDCVIHHGALRLAVQWLDEHRPNALKQS